MIHCAIYIRKSREEKDKPSQRLTVQREQLPAYATAHGWQYEIYDDGHASAARGKVESLPQRSRLETDIRAGKIGIILTIELSRLSRDDSLQDYVAWLHLCSVHKVKLATMSRILDPGQHSDWMLLLMEGGFSSVEMKVMQERMKEGRDRAYATGKHMGGICPDPYKFDPVKKIPVINPDEIDWYRKVWQMAETMSCRQIMIELGSPFTKTYRALRDSRLNYCLAQRINKTTGETIPCEWEPCITADQVAKIRQTRQRLEIFGKQGFKSEAGGLLTALSLTYCGHCGAAIWSIYDYHIRADGTRNKFYYCSRNERATTCKQSRKISQAHIDNLVVSHFAETFERLDELKKQWLITQGDNTDGRAIQTLNKEEEALQAKKQRLIDAVMEGIFDNSEILASKTSIDNQLATIKNKRLTIMANLMSPDWSALQLSAKEIQELSNSDQRAILQAGIKKILIYNSTISIEYPFPITPTESTAILDLPSKYSKTRG